MRFDASEQTFAVETVRRVGQLVRHIQQEMVTPALSKEDRSPVTVADYAAQALVGHLLAEAFADDVLVAEEDADQLRRPEQQAVRDQVTAHVRHALPEATPEQVCEWIDRGRAESAHRFWTLDPIDGTKGFLRGQQYAVALALVVDGTVRLGALACPHLSDGCRAEIGGPGSLLVAAAGQGTWLAPLDGGEFRPLSVSNRDHPAEARLLRSFESGHTNVGQIGELAEALGTAAEPVAMDSQAKFAVLAAGAAELLLRLISPARPDYREKIWDQAAGSLIVEEAGGRVTDLRGKPLDFAQGRTLAANRGVVASNGRLHDAALKALRSIGA